MIKIEKIQAEQATLVRGGVRQPLVLHSHITAEELATIEALSGSIVYSIDETEVKELTFQSKPAATAPLIKQPAPRVVQPAAKTAKQTPEPTVAETASK